jgi:uncharacterized membrane protein YidH (DUF202 family)
VLGLPPFRGFILADKMIRNFRDHSANERTFLAWVRTSIAVMAFGFLVEKFDLFLEFAGPSLAGRTLILPFPILKAKIADLGHNRSRSSHIS